jgi:hypothetical protein
METLGFEDPTRNKPREPEEWKFHTGMNGIPFRTKKQSVPHYKHDDPERSRPKAVQEVHTEVFDISDPKRLEEMNAVLNLCSRGAGRVMEKEVQYDPDIKNWRVFMMWAVFFYEDPSEYTVEKQRHVFR